jgi:hypothetical protein
LFPKDEMIFDVMEFARGEGERREGARPRAVLESYEVMDKFLVEVIEGRECRILGRLRS